jgi:signal transduction histidine kinase/CheY-like chemotaxis protein/HAMP domain-containing protein
MTLNYRLVLITLVILLVTSVASTFVYYSLSETLLTKYQSKAVLNSTNDFVFEFEQLLEEPTDDFVKIQPLITRDFKSINIDSTHIDFIFTLVNDSLINMSEFKIKQTSYLNFNSQSFKQLFRDNPNIILFYNQLANNRIVYYGRLLTPSLLDNIAKNIHADIAYTINNVPIEVSDSKINQIYFADLIKAVSDLKFKNNFDLFLEASSNYDFLAAMYSPKHIVSPGGKIEFIVFNTFKEGADFRKTLRIVMILIGVAGGAVTVIFVLFFTTKLRKQISYLREGAEITKKGNFDHQIPIITKDELGALGNSFNTMVNELKQRERTEKEFTEFLKLINQNPTLAEVSDAALSKIIRSANLSFGALHLVEKNSLELVTSYGVISDTTKPIHQGDLYNNAIQKKDAVEFFFKDNYPEVKTWLTTIKVKYIIIYPILYNKEVIALLELASESVPSSNVKIYLDNIHEQLAVGLVNSKSLQQLENYVAELKKLNEEYEKQNKQIIEQNKELIELHQKLKEKAVELEIQTDKAIELTKVKSQFLASMSHELRTPLISILGLTELLIKEKGKKPKLVDRLNVVYRNGKKLLNLITNILEFSRLESDKIEVRKESFFLNDMIDEIVPNITQLAEEKKLKFFLNIPKGKNLLVNTDRIKLEQIINNLLVNAIKFTELGEVKLSIELLENNSVKFIISDTGIGISKENQENIFSEFQQIDNAQWQKAPGAGLGLTICKKYVELLGGSISVRSEIGFGATFRFTLNNILLDIIELEEIRKTEEVSEDDISNIPKSALIACQSEETVKLVGDYIKSYNYSFQAVNSCEDFLSETSNKFYDLIILSPDLKSGNVWELIVSLKKNIKYSTTPVILINIFEEKKVGWLPTIHDFLLKPLSDKKLNEAIDNIELHVKSKIDKIFFITTKKEYSGISLNEKRKDSIYYIKNPDSIFNYLQKENIQVVIFDLVELYSDIFKFHYELQKMKLTHNVFTILLLDENKTKTLSSKLNQALNHYTLESKNHPLDILKVLKERLKIDDSQLLSKNNLIEEKSDLKIDSTILKIKKANRPTILIVDDDNDTLYTIGEIVNENDYHTIFAHNGIECLLMLNHVTPDLILLDIMMPQMDGFETIKRIRSNSKFANLPVIALTAYAMLDNKSIITKNGFNDLITKPVSSSALITKIEKYFKSEMSK